MRANGDNLNKAESIANLVERTAEEWARLEPGGELVRAWPAHRRARRASSTRRRPHRAA